MHDIELRWVRRNPRSVSAFEYFTLTTRIIASTAGLEREGVHSFGWRFSIAIIKLILARSIQVRRWLTCLRKNPQSRLMADWAILGIRPRESVRWGDLRWLLELHHLSFLHQRWDIPIETWWCPVRRWESGGKILSLKMNTFFQYSPLSTENVCRDRGY